MKPCHPKGAAGRSQRERSPPLDAPHGLGHCARPMIGFHKDRLEYDEALETDLIGELESAGIVHRPQEIALDHPLSKYWFQPSPLKPFVTTPAALKMHGLETIVDCLRALQHEAQKYAGLDYLQVFQIGGAEDNVLWIIEDNDGGAITALLASDY